jgi:hypothetical protein
MRRKHAATLPLLGTASIAYRKTSCIEINPNHGLRLASQEYQAHTETEPIDLRRGPFSDAPAPTRSSVGSPRHGRIPSSRCQVKQPLASRTYPGSGTVCSLGLDTLAAVSRQQELVEPDGIEPTTSCLQSTRSPN